MGCDVHTATWHYAQGSGGTWGRWQAPLGHVSPELLKGSLHEVIGWIKGAAIGQVWNYHFCSSRACPAVFLAYSVLSAGLWPMACCIVPQYTQEEKAPPGFWDQHAPRSEPQHPPLQ